MSIHYKLPLIFSENIIDRRNMYPLIQERQLLQLKNYKMLHRQILFLSHHFNDFLIYILNTQSPFGLILTLSCYWVVHFSDAPNKGHLAYFSYT